MGFLTKLFGTNMAKEIKRIDPIVRKIEALEEEYKGLTDAQLQAKTAEFKARYAGGETLDMAELQEAWEAKLEPVFPYRSSANLRLAEPAGAAAFRDAQSRGADEGT